MGVRVPRITLQADFGDDAAFGELSLLSAGYGLHQAWVYATMFGATSIFGTKAYISGIYGSHVSLAFLVSIVVFAACLLFAGITNQRFLTTYISKKMLVGGAILACLGTLLLIPASASPLLVLEVVSGILTGISSAILILFWGTAFARCDSASIVLNSGVALCIAIAIYAVVLHYVPFPFGGILTAAIPLVELGILWNKTPQPFSKRNEIPVFKPLPVNHAKFFVRFGLPVFIFGVALGTLRQTSIQNVVPASNATDQIIMLLAAGCASVLIMITLVALGGGERWSRYFRPLIPFIAVSLFFLPFSGAQDSVFASFILIVGYLCFETLMWIFFGELSQRFRLSPIFVFGIGRGLLALAALLGSLFPVVAANWVQVLPFGEQAIIMVVLLIMVFAYALLPREREIEAIVIPCPLVKAVSSSLDASSSAQTHSTEHGCPGKRIAAKIDANEESAHTTPPGFVEPETKPTSELPSSQDNSKQQAQPLKSREPNNPEQDQRRGGRFRAKCELVANTYLLSSRETEVMFFLAKGHNAAYIQEKLYISEGTAKTHIRHIYRKLDVHTQQELMRLVESAGNPE